MLLQVAVVSALVGASWCGELDFPPGFRFGAATAAYQVEGAWNSSGRGESIWDRFAHSKRGAIVDGTSGDVACDSYHQWRRDVQLAKELGLHFYRFSISWPRLLPSGYPNEISEDGKTYYSNLIDELLRNGIEPVVTLYHWDLPQIFQNLGGWTNPLISEWFADYATVAYSLYADRVKTWLTINEPIVICDIAYSGIHAPGIVDRDIAPYVCNKNTLLAHAKAWRIYDEEFRDKYHGQVSVANHLMWYEAAAAEDEELAELARELFVGRFSHPIFTEEGGWPPSVVKLLEQNSKREGYPWSRLPVLSTEEINFIKGTYDFFAVNHYSSRLVRKSRLDEDPGLWPFTGVPELGASLEAAPDWKQAGSFWFRVFPEGLRRQLAWVKKHYGDVSILITENGFSTTESDLSDEARVQYYRDYLEQVLLAIKEDAVNVIGYTAWTLIDNFEWSEGYTSKFGLYKVDFSVDERTRTPRDSARYYARIIRRHSLDVVGDNSNGDDRSWNFFLFYCIIIFIIILVNSC